MKQINLSTIIFLALQLQLVLGVCGRRSSPAFRCIANSISSKSKDDWLTMECFLIRTANAEINGDVSIQPTLFFNCALQAIQVKSYERWDTAIIKQKLNDQMSSGKTTDLQACHRKHKMSCPETHTAITCQHAVDRGFKSFS